MAMFMMNAANENSVHPED